MHTILVATEPYIELAQKIAQHLNVQAYPITTTRFADSELLVDLKASDLSLASLHVIIVHSTARPVNDSLVQLLLTIHLLKSKGAAKITAVIPYFGYARQDEQNGMESVAQFVIRMLRDAGADDMVTVELHNPDIKQNAALPIKEIILHHKIAEIIKQQDDHQDWTIIAPDQGSSDRAYAIAKEVNAPVMVYDKDRYAVNKTRLKSHQGACSTRNGILVDDIIDTGSTLVHVAQQLHEADPKTCLFAFCVHPVLSNNAAQKIQESPFERLWITNTIPYMHNEMPAKCTILDVSKEIAEQLRLML